MPKPAPIVLDPTVPVTITVDFQSLHHAAFRLFTVAGASQKPQLLKLGSADTTFSVSPVRLKKGLLWEFAFFKESAPFQAALVFRQKGDPHLVSITAKGDELLTQGEVAFA